MEFSKRVFDLSREDKNTIATQMAELTSMYANLIVKLAEKYEIDPDDLLISASGAIIAVGVFDAGDEVDPMDLSAWTKKGEIN